MHEIPLLINIGVGLAAAPVASSADGVRMERGVRD
jgi:hypothetical protein